MGRFLIPLSEYNRIYQVAHGVRQAFGESEKGCIFFACCGAMILNKHYNIPSRAVAGGFALCLNSSPEIAFFGEDKGGHLVTSPEGFHMWVQTETHIIDFMAPIFPEAFGERNAAIPRRMFQRSIGSEAESLESVTSPGDFFTFPDVELTEALIDRFLGQASSGDLLGVADTWFGNRRSKQLKTIEMGDSAGDRYQLTLPRTTATGSW